MLDDFDTHYEAIKQSERDLYSTPDRHLETEEVKQKEANLKDAIEGFLDKMPRVFDPFAGGGAIPLEASRLGCRSFGNDINPVAHIIQKGSLEFPQKYGKPIVYSRGEFIKRYGEDELKRVSAENSLYAGGDKVKIENRLSFDVEFYARELLKRAEAEIGHFYPADDRGKKPIAYYWARVGTCSNPSCRAEVPLLKGFYLVNKSDKKIYLNPVIKDKEISFEIKNGKYDETEIGSWNNRTNLTCPVCSGLTDSKELKRQFINGESKEKLLAVMWQGKNKKDYKIPSESEAEILDTLPNIDRTKFSSNLPTGKYAGFGTPPWGIKDYVQMYSSRQFLTMNTLIEKLDEVKKEINSESDYGKAIVTYLAILIDRFITRFTSFNIWDNGYEKVAMLFGRQAVQMIFDYAEVNPFSDVGANLASQVEWINEYLASESDSPFSTALQNASSGEKEQFPEKSLTAVITDPPYYDAIAYADLSDFFYMWLKHNLGDIYPTNFATPQTPKSDECTALKHHHKDDMKIAKQHFENKLLQIFDAIEHQTSDVVSIMFAHQSTEAWTTLCNSIIGAKMNITGSWAVDTELTSALKSKKAFLSSSVTVSCKPANRSGFGDYRQVKAAIEKKVEEEVAELYGLGFRGADLLTACFGKAVGEFGKYSRVEKASGDEVTVAELLEMTRESAFNALLKGFKGDDFTKFYIGWLELYGFTESDFDDAAKFARVGLSINVQDLFTNHLFRKNGNKQSLADYVHRSEKIRNLGENPNSSLIDQVHRAMNLYKNGTRPALLSYIGKVAASAESSFWRVLTSLD